MASTRPPQFTAPSAIVPLEERPHRDTFTLPDLTPVHFDEDKERKHIVIKLGSVPEPKEDGSHARFPGPKEEQETSLQPLLEFIPLGRQARTSPAQVNEDRAVRAEVLEMKASVGHVTFKDLWSGLYACRLTACCRRKRESLNAPLSLQSGFVGMSSSAIRSSSVLRSPIAKMSCATSCTAAWVYVMTMRRASLTSSWIGPLFGRVQVHRSRAPGCKDRSPIRKSLAT